MEDHHHAEKGENRPGRDRLGRHRKGERHQRREDPVRERAEGLSLRTEPLRKDLRDQDPDDRALTDGMRGEEQEEQTAASGPFPTANDSAAPKSDTR